MTKERTRNALDLAALALKLAEITSAIGKVKPDGYNEHSKFQFISHEQLSAILRDMLLERKVTIIPGFHKLEETHIPAGNKTAIRTIAYGTVKIIDAETGATIDTDMAGGDIDYGGKSSGQAETEAFKRLLLKLFLVSSKDDIDADARATTVGVGHHPITAEQVKQLEQTIAETKANIPKFLQYMQVSSLDQITTGQLPIAIAALDKKKKKSA
jgi:hypothetical protein